MSIDSDEIYKRIMLAAQAWAQADGEWRDLKEMEPLILAEIINHTEGESFADRKSKALASPEFRLHKAKKIAAETKANILKANYKAAQNWSELKRSEESTRRAEMKL